MSSNYSCVLKTLETIIIVPPISEDSINTPMRNIFTFYLK